MVRPMPVRKRPEKLSPEPPGDDVRELQDPEHTEADFLRDLERATTDRASELLEPDRASGRD